MRNLLDYEPVGVELVNGQYQCNFDVEQKEIDGRIVYEFDSVYTNELSGEAIKNAIIAYKYPLDRQLELLNEFLANDASEKWNEYQAWRQHAKDVVANLDLNIV